MRKDVKTGLLIGTALCLAATVWFCVYQQVLEQPLMEEVLSEKRHLFEEQETDKQIFLSDKIETEAESESSIRIHLVTQGQTLSDISKMYYGNAGYWNRIYKANKQLLAKGPNALKAGMKLVIPVDD